MWSYVVVMRGSHVANGCVESYEAAMGRAYDYMSTWKQIDYVLVFFSARGVM